MAAHVLRLSSPATVREEGGAGGHSAAQYRIADRGLAGAIYNLQGAGCRRGSGPRSKDCKVALVRLQHRSRNLAKFESTERLLHCYTTLRVHCCTCTVAKGQLLVISSKVGKPAKIKSTVIVRELLKMNSPLPLGFSKLKRI